MTFTHEFLIYPHIINRSGKEFKTCYCKKHKKWSSENLSSPTHRPYAIFIILFPLPRSVNKRIAL